MNISKFAKVGNAPMIKAIGVQKNYKEEYITSQTIDPVASGCFACPNKQFVDYLDFLSGDSKTMVLQRCEACTHCIWKTVTDVRYVNERNIFGNEPRVPAIALKLLLVYHFLNPDEHGLVRNISVSKIAAYVGCTTRSVHNSNVLLQHYGYITFAPDTKKHHFQVFLKEYPTYHLTADKGGRGYVTLNSAFLEKFVKVKEVLELRILLRTAMSADRQESVSIDFDATKRYLPQYCKTGIITKAINKLSGFFDSLSFSEDGASVKLSENLRGRYIFDSLVTENKSKLEGYLKALNDAIKSCNSFHDNKNINAAFLNKAGIKTKISFAGKTSFLPFHLKPADFKDLAVLAATYSYEEVCTCIGIAYEKYHIQKKKFSIGAVTRTMLCGLLSC